MKKNIFLNNIVNLPLNIKLIISSTLITNIGNGMYTIALSKLVYDKTNSAMAFGGVIILQYIIMFLVQFWAGFIVDRNNPKHVSIICDLINGFIVLSGGLISIFTDIGLGYLFVGIIIMNIVNPVYKSANFTLLPTIVEDNTMLLKVTSITITLFQVGQLIGCALVAPIMIIFNPETALIIDGVTFILSAFINSFIIIKAFNKKIVCEGMFKGIIKDWMEFFKVLHNNKSFVAHLIMSTGDYISINFFNVMLVPMVTLWYENNSLYISLYDSGFALGAMLITTLIIFISNKIGVNNSAFIGLLIQSVLFISMIFSRNPLITFFLMLIFGASNSFSNAIFTSNLQGRCEGPIKGRVSAFRNFIVSILTIILVPIVSKYFDISIIYGLIISASILFIYSFVSYILGRKFVFGKDYLSQNVKSNL